MSALRDLIERGQQYPNEAGTTGFVTDIKGLEPILAELSRRVPVGIKTTSDDGDHISFEVTIGFLISRSELDAEEATS